MPSVSTVITTYNRAELLPRAIESAKKAASDVEVIVVDDCSGDETPEVCARIEGIHYVRLSRNQGLANARNVGIAECTSEFIAFLDDDDLRLPGSLDKQLTVLKARASAAFCYGQALIGDARRQLPPARSIRSHVRRATSSGICRQALRVQQLTLDRPRARSASRTQCRSSRRNFQNRAFEIWQVLIDLMSRAHYRTCRAYFARSEYSVLHVFSPDTGATLMIRAGKEAGIPVLYHEMGTPHYLPALDSSYRRLEKVLPLCSKVAALSPILARQWSERFPFLSPVTVLPLIAEDSSMLTVSAQLNTKGAGEIIFGTAARIEMGKGPFVLAEALALVRQRRADVLVRLAGTGPATPEVKARVRELGVNDSGEFVGAYEGTVGCSAFMRTLDVFVLPSFAEGTSKSVIEAMSHGLPAITTDVGGLPDLITSDSGNLIPPGDSKALADAMLRLASDPALQERMGRAARERYLQLFAPDAVLSMLTTTYSRVTGNAYDEEARLLVSAGLE